MNKLERTQTTQRKFKKRLKAMGIKHIEYSFKNQGKPCSCWACKKKRYVRSTVKLASAEYELKVKDYSTLDYLYGLPKPSRISSFCSTYNYVKHNVANYRAYKYCNR